MCIFIFDISTEMKQTFLFCIELFLLLAEMVVHGNAAGSRRLRTTPSPDFLHTPVNVTYYKGELAVLYCSIQNLGTKTVIWRRQDNPTPLTIGTITYSPEIRFQISHVASSNNWDLFIKDVQLEDQGIYECQVSARNRSIRRMVSLTVLDLKDEKAIQIQGPEYVEKGDRVILKCNATGHRYPPDEMDWFKNGEKIIANVDKGVQISKQYSLSRRTFSSALVIDKARMEDDGTYVCRSSNKQITNIKLHVLNADTYNVKRGTEERKENSWSDIMDRSTSAGNGGLNLFVLIISGIMTLL